MNKEQKAYSFIRKKIQSGRWAIGYQINEPDLARMIGMSRIPIQRVLPRLEAEGLIELKPRHGMTVICSERYNKAAIERYKERFK